MTTQQFSSLEQLVSQPDHLRDLEWEQKFLENFSGAQVEVVQETPQTGPDGFPYLSVRTGPQAKEPVAKLVQWLSERGIGIVVNADKNYPDYIFTYGMIWSLQKNGRLLVPEQKPFETQVRLSEQQRLLAGPPTEEYLPEFVRKLLRQFLAEQGVWSAKILMLSQDRQNYDLCFSLEALGNPPATERSGVAQALSWFLPPTYSLVLVSEKGLPHFLLL